MSDEEVPSGAQQSSQAQGAPRGIPLPPAFLNDGRESFQLWARRYEVIQEARYKDSGVDLPTVLAAELPTRLPPELFIVWDNLPQETQCSYAETKKQLQAAFGQKDVIASFLTFPNARHRLPNEAMEVYAADVCRLVKEAFPDFEQNATEYMKMSRFIAGLDQELQVKCHEREVKTFKEAFDVASQAERARHAASAWLRANEHPVVDKINQRIGDVTGLDVTTAEHLQVANYGIGGQYEPHFDFEVKDELEFKELGTGNRIATWLFYMSDVPAGGATVFTNVGAAVQPIKGTAVFWYNLYPSGERDDQTRHAACPVLVGSKWVSTKWIHERGQEFRRGCDLQETD